MATKGGEIDQDDLKVILDELKKETPEMNENFISLTAQECSDREIRGCCDLDQ